jgi:large subunit ribosomal protein L4
MASVQAPLFSATGEAQGQFDLPESLFGATGSRRVLQEVIIGIQANQRRGTSSTKTRGFVSGGGHKPWKQKGTGNARAGSIRSPLWRKGGIIFGPLPRSYRIDLDQAKRLTALQTALSEKAKVSGLGVFDALEMKEAKTRQAQIILSKAGVSGKTLIVVDKKDETLYRAFGNLKNVCMMDASEVNAWALTASPKVFFTKAALEALEKRFPSATTSWRTRQSLSGGKGSS